jgi:hypothetical protein
MLSASCIFPAKHRGSRVSSRKPERRAINEKNYKICDHRRRTPANAAETVHCSGREV